MLQGKRTILFNLVGLLVAIIGGTQFNEWLAAYAPQMIGAGALANMILRSITKTPVWRSKGASLSKRYRWQKPSAILLCVMLGATASGCAMTYTGARSEDNAKLFNLSFSVGGSIINGKRQGAIYKGSAVDDAGNNINWEMGTTDSSDQMSSEATAMQELIRAATKGAVQGALEGVTP